jgi:hypothetical protein
MRDLRAIGKVTGDEYSMFRSAGQRTVIRGFGNEIAVTPEIASLIKSGGLGKWSGHTHPPGFPTVASPVDRNWLPVGQERSVIYHDRGRTYFHSSPMEDAAFESARMSALMRKWYGQ